MRLCAPFFARHFGPPGGPQASSNEPEKLNTFGVRYHGINSNYQKDFEAKKDGKRESLKPPSLFNDLNIQLTKQSNYKESYIPRSNEVRTSRKGRLSM